MGGWNNVNKRVDGSSSSLFLIEKRGFGVGKHYFYKTGFVIKTTSLHNMPFRPGREPYGRIEIVDLFFGDIFIPHPPG